MLHLAPRAGRSSCRFWGSKKGQPQGCFPVWEERTPETGLFWGVKDGGCFFKKNQRTLFAGHVDSLLVIEDDLFNSINANVFSNSVYIYISYLDPMGTFLLHAFLSLPVTTRDLCQRLTCDPATHWLHNNSPTGTKAKRFIYELRRSREVPGRCSIWVPTRKKTSERGSNISNTQRMVFTNIYHQNCPNLCQYNIYILYHTLSVWVWEQNKGTQESLTFFVRFLFSRKKTYEYFTLGTFRSSLAHQVDLRQKFTAESGDLWEVVGSSTLDDDEPQSPW